MCFFFFFFKQKTAYEMLRSLVGSEMCIRDRGTVIIAFGLTAFTMITHPFPNRRASESPVLRTDIPYVLHRTWKDKNLPAWATIPAQSWRLKNPRLQIVLHTDADIEALVRSKYPVLKPAYDQMLPIERGDLGRYLILHQHGGYYADLDVSCTLPVEQWGLKDRNLANVQFWTGVEKGTLRIDWYDHFARRLQLVQWTIAAVPGHPILGLLLEMIREHFDHGKPSGRSHPKAVVNATGPGIFTDAVFRWLEQQYNVSLLDDIPATAARGFHAGGVRVLPQVGFGYGSAGEEPEGTVLVRHHFQGSWKKPTQDRLRRV
eukprot:TRINITY_DN45334_c0_g1_i2.p1 TRINITY_DN45334_c0_g1~~TRINITY_DN45334_c0_g1_i2.p1  ORF type:complete len:317 (+),score=63.60 TRINITY_DN45334_c0_g1_i2:61-1011(+)